MAFRDDHEALAHRLDVLERELVEVRRERDDLAKQVDKLRADNARLKKELDDMPRPPPPARKKEVSSSKKKNPPIWLLLMFLVPAVVIAFKACPKKKKEAAKEPSSASPSAPAPAKPPGDEERILAANYIRSILDSADVPLRTGHGDLDQAHSTLQGAATVASLSPEMDEVLGAYLEVAKGYLVQRQEAARRSRAGLSVEDARAEDRQAFLAASDALRDLFRPAYVEVRARAADRYAIGSSQRAFLAFGHRAVDFHDLAIDERADVAAVERAYRDLVAQFELGGGTLPKHAPEVVKFAGEAHQAIVAAGQSGVPGARFPLRIMMDYIRMSSLDTLQPF